MNSQKKVGVIACVGIILVVQTLVQKPNQPTQQSSTLDAGMTGCAFRIIMGEEYADSSFYQQTPEDIQHSVDRGLNWLAKAQHKDGGWGAGFHRSQHIIDPHAVESDPGSTAMVAMALLRSGSTLESGLYSEQLQRAVDYLVQVVQATPERQATLNSPEATQLQTKLGGNIDAVLAAQFFSNLLVELEPSDSRYVAVNESLNQCITKIERAIGEDGRVAGAGWAGILQTGLATTALESAQQVGVEVDEELLEVTLDYQAQKFDRSSGSVETGDGAGVMLYSVAGANRANAKKARKAREALEKASQEPADQRSEQEILQQDLEITFEEAAELVEAYGDYDKTKTLSMNEEVVQGFGSDGGEEFISFLQTGESLILSGDEDWKKWYEKTSDQLLKIQGENGSWRGHHCITSPVICTATCVLILSINNDVDRLLAMGKD